jgi:hypothetical protein
MCACARARTTRFSREIGSSGDRECGGSPDDSTLLSAALCASFKDVEHSCQQCGNTVEDGRPFCPQCRAPQISVKIAIPDSEIAPGLSSHTDQFPSDASVETRLASSHARQAMPGSAMDRAVAAHSAIKAGVLGVFIGAIPLIGITLTGALAVYFYRRKSGLILPGALGARLGAAAGLVVFAIGAFFTVVIIASHGQQQFIDFMMTTFQRFGANTADPRIQASLQNLFTPSGQVASFIVTVGFASVGGALASLFLRSRGPRL